MPSLLNRFAPSRIALILALCVALAPLSCEAETTSSAYQFIGGTMNVIYGDEKFPVSGMSDGYIHFQDGKKSRRTKSTAVCSLAFQPALTTTFVRVDNLKIQYSSLNQMRKEADSVTASLDQLNGIGDIVQEMVAERRYEDASLADTAYITADLIPNTDLENVYCAVVVQFGERYIKSDQKIPAGAFVRAEYIGDLEAGIFTTLKIRKTFDTFLVEGARVGLFFFEESGRPLASNLSPRLKIMDVDPTPPHAPLGPELGSIR